MRPAPASRLLIAAALVLTSLPAARAQSQTPTQPAAAATTAAAPKPVTAPTPQRIVREGVAIELSVEPSATAHAAASAPAATAPAAAPAAEIKEGGEAVVTFKITDATTGQPLSSLRPAAWIDGRDARGAATADAATAACKGKIQSFLQSSLSARPDVDLNTFYILALNQEPNISVIDPQLGLGTTKLLTLVLLKGAGADWVMSADQRRLFVSMPNVNQVAVVDTTTWKVVANVDTGARPGRVRLQPDGKYLWVAYDGLAPSDAGGVTVIDTDTLRAVAGIETGAGAPHDLALSADGRAAFVTNRASGTVTVIDAARLSKVRDVKTGPAPASVAYSPAARAAYVADEADGSVVAIDPARAGAAARVQTRPGVVGLRFAPDGRHGFVVNRKDSAVHVFDAATNRLLHTVPTGQSPDQVAFTKQFAYVRSLGSEQVTMIRLGEIGKPSIEQSVTKFPGGQAAPRQSPHAAGLASALMNAPEDGSMLVANPADQMIYYYSEGMAAPMGSFRNYRRQPVALQVWDASLRETASGVYRTRARMSGAGTYDVAFLLDSPRVTHCFELAVAPDPALAKRRRLPIRVEPLLDGSRVASRRPTQLRFKVTDAETGRPRADLKDVGVLAFLSPGIWQQREWARHVGEGVYEVSFTPPQDGVYYVFFQCPSLGVAFRQLPHLILTAGRQPQPAKTAEGARP